MLKLKQVIRILPKVKPQVKSAAIITIMPISNQYLKKKLLNLEEATRMVVEQKKFQMKKKSRNTQKKQIQKPRRKKIVQKLLSEKTKMIMQKEKTTD